MYWTDKEERNFKRQLGFEVESHKKLAFLYEQMNEEAKVKFTVEAVDFNKSSQYAKLQKKGVDTILHLETGKKLYVQEKHIRNKDTVYLEYMKPNGEVSWALDKGELSNILVFHMVQYGTAYVVNTQQLVALVEEKLPTWKWQYSKNIAVHSGYTGIKIPVEELLVHKRRLQLKEYYKDKDRGWLAALGL